jgi:hypothetical protein
MEGKNESTLVKRRKMRAMSLSVALWRVFMGILRRFLVCQWKGVF